jgi:hypothetical protein
LLWSESCLVATSTDEIDVTRVHGKLHLPDKSNDYRRHAPRIDRKYEAKTLIVRERQDTVTTKYFGYRDKSIVQKFSQRFGYKTGVSGSGEK